MNNIKKLFFAGILIIILLYLVLHFLPLQELSLDNNISKTKISSSVPDSSSELRLNEKDASRILVLFLTSYESKLPQGTSIKDYEISFDNSMIKINIKFQKDNFLIDLPVKLNLEISPSTQNNIICLDVKEAQIAGILVFPSTAVEQLANFISLPSTISFNESQILIDLTESPVEIINIDFDNEDLLLAFRFKSAHS